MLTAGLPTAGLKVHPMCSALGVKLQLSHKMSYLGSHCLHPDTACAASFSATLLSLCQNLMHAHGTLFALP